MVFIRYIKASHTRKSFPESLYFIYFHSICHKLWTLSIHDLNTKCQSCILTGKSDAKLTGHLLFLFDSQGHIQEIEMFFEKIRITFISTGKHIIVYYFKPIEIISMCNQKYVFPLWSNVCLIYKLNCVTTYLCGII